MLEELLSHLDLL